MDVRQTAVVVLTLWSLLVSGQSPAACKPGGWFGSLCQYKCRCSDNNCTKDGVCVNDVPCQKGWFGPACQYADLAYGRSSDRNITDANDNTCLTTPTRITANVTLDNRYHVTWLRVRLSKPDFLYNLTVHFREGESLSCTNIRTARVDSTTLDIHCDLNETVEHVIVSGPGVQDLCSVYISGGRNVALQQKASVSSAYARNVLSNEAEKAVDGITDPKFFRSYSCSHTAEYGDSNPNLNITFSRLQHVTRYVLYNRDDFKHRLEGFELRSFGPSMTPVFNYTDRSDSIKDVYTVIPAQVTSPIHLVNIAVYQHARILTLCELEVYGDTACQPGQYGRECEHSCNCAGGQSCFVSTGGCPSGCAAGYLGQDCWTGCDVGRHGPGCQTSCSQLCARDKDRGQHLCDNINGTCLYGCQSGYQGSTCAERCDVGSYGPRCNVSCSQFCARGKDRGHHFCDNMNGTCLYGCQSGYQGSTCAERCDVGRHGPGCQTSCSQFCARGKVRGQHLCDNINGTCLYGCQSGYQGSTCAERCDVGSYGPRCNDSCSQFCARGKDRGHHFCDNMNGTCLYGCQSGYQGSTCAERCDVGSYGPRCNASCSQFCARDKNRGQHFCDNMNGRCLYGCQSGYKGSTCAERCDVGHHGPGCQTSCSQLCAIDKDRGQHFCDNINGTCLHGCQSGYQGSTCAERCGVGRHGPRCRSSCSQFCARDKGRGQHFCDNINGTCLFGCQSGYQGSTCAERCDVGSYGPRCNVSCSQFCARDKNRGQHFCDNIDGTCLHGCQSGYQGSTCAERCDVGLHGPRCQSSCSQFCARDNDHGQHFCDIINGTCLHGCQSGYQGPTCAEKLPSNVVVVVVAVLGVVGVLVLVMVAVRFYRRHTVSNYGSTLDLIDNDDDDVEYDESYFNDVNSSTSEAAATSTQHQVKQAGSVRAAVPGSTTLQSQHERVLQLCTLNHIK